MSTKGASVQDSNVSANSAVYGGGGLYFSGGAIGTVYSTLIASNTASEGSGSGILVSPQPESGMRRAEVEAHVASAGHESSFKHHQIDVR